MVEFKDAIHAREDDQHAAFAGQRAARKAGARTPTNERNIKLSGKAGDARDFFGRSRKNHAIRTALLDGAIVFVEEQLLRPAENSPVAEQAIEFADEARVHEEQVEGKLPRATIQRKLSGG
jgi:hypothetical protein